MDHILREFKEADAGKVRELILGILSKEYPFDKSAYSDSDLEKIAQTYGGAKDVFFVLEEGSNIAGTIAVKTETPDSALIRRFFVDVKRRRHGYGSELLEKAIAFCKAKGYKKVYFRCTDRMSDAVKLCMKKGFKETETLSVSGFNIHKLELGL